MGICMLPPKGRWCHVSSWLTAASTLDGKRFSMIIVDGKPPSCGTCLELEQNKLRGSVIDNPTNEANDQRRPGLDESAGSGNGDQARQRPVACKAGSAGTALLRHAHG